MAKIIQVRVDDELKVSADLLLTSLGLDTSTAVRMFLVASTEAGGIPFAVAHGATTTRPFGRLFLGALSTKVS